MHRPAFYLELPEFTVAAASVSRFLYGAIKPLFLFMFMIRTSLFWHVHSQKARPLRKMLQQRSRYAYAAVAAALGCLAYCRWPNHDGSNNDSDYSSGHVHVTLVVEANDGANNDSNTTNADNNEGWGQFVIFS